MQVPSASVTSPIKRTLSVCPVCLTKVPAEVYERDGSVFMRKRCPAHGDEEVLVASDAAFYWHDDKREGAACGDGCMLGHSCTLIFEITDACNLTCPTCFTASSPQKARAMTVAELDAKLERLLAGGRKDVDIVQLSGGEPTIHPDLERMIEVCFARGIRRVYVNTNGVKLGKDPDLAKRLGALGGNDARLQIYLQLDGLRDETSSLIRGRRGLSDVKRRAIANATEQGLYVLPVMTVTRDVNTTEIGDVIRTALAHHPKMNTVILQPAFYAGRYEHERHNAGRITVGEVARLVEEQTAGMFTRQDFGPLPCSSPNCFAMAVGLKRGDRVIPISRYFPRFETWKEPAVAKQVARFADRLPQNLVDVLAEDDLLDELLDLLASGDDADVDWHDYKSFFLVGIKPFMDAHTYDQDRVDRCCVHVVDSSGAPVSLCEYNTLRRPRGLT